MEIVFVAFWQWWLLVPVAFLVLSLVFIIMEETTSFLWTETAAFITFLIGFFGGILTLAAAFSVWASGVDDANRLFETTYNVAIQSGEIPLARHEQKTMLLFTTEGEQACIIKTDDSHYTVTCGKEELTPVN